MRKITAKSCTAIQSTAQSTFKKSLFYSISVTNYHNSHANPFLDKELKYHQNKNTVKVEH